jgi:hypothetical protein
MKKFVLLTALAAILVGIVGCAGEDNASTEDNTAPATTDAGTGTTE